MKRQSRPKSGGSSTSKASESESKRVELIRALGAPVALADAWIAGGLAADVAAAEWEITLEAIRYSSPSRPRR